MKYELKQGDLESLIKNETIPEQQRKRYQAMLDRLKAKEALEKMCKRCVNNEMCQGTGCEPKKTLAKMIEMKGETND